MAVLPRQVWHVSRILINSQDVYFEQFSAIATPQQADLFAGVAKTEAGQKVQTIRDAVIAAGVGGNLDGYTGADFFSAQTARINRFKQIYWLLMPVLIPRAQAKQGVGSLLSHRKSVH